MKNKDDYEAKLSEAMDGKSDQLVDFVKWLENNLRESAMRDGYIKQIKEDIEAYKLYSGRNK